MKTLLVRTNLAAMIAMLSTGVAYAEERTMAGYVVDSSNTLVSSGYEPCIRTGSWTPDMAIMECDPDLVKTAQAPPPVETRTRAEPAPVPMPAPVLIQIQSDTVFAFNSAIIRQEGRRDLDEQVVKVMKQNKQIDMITITGHTDRIGSSTYNMNLSQQRADSVKAYLIEHGISSDRIQTKGLGSSDPVISCNAVKGKISGTNKELVECLRPNRRVDIEIKTRSPVAR